MGYYVSVMIGIRTGGVFSPPPDLEDMEKRIKKVQRELDMEYYFETEYAMTRHRHLTMPKGDYVVLAGVSNGWHWRYVSKFAKALSKEFGTEVMAMTWDEQTNKINCGVFLDGEEIRKVNEDPVWSLLRRVA